MCSKDFQNRRTFPGTEGGPFDLLVKIWDWIEKIPWPFFLLALLLLAWSVNRHDQYGAVILGGVFLLDYLLMRGLPLFRISYGPAKPPTLMLALLRLPFSLLPFGENLVFQIIGTVLVIYGFWIEPRQLRLTHQKLTAEGFKPARPLRLLHLGDLHFERKTRREDQLLEMVRELQPDVILFSGDFLSYSYTYDRETWSAANAFLRSFSAPLGVFCVRGSPPVDPEPVLGEILQGTEFVRLQNEYRTVPFGEENFDLIGVNCSHNPEQDRELLQQAATGSHASLKILLYHSPDLAPEAAEAGITLQLSGHTHGGQVRLPGFGALYAASLYGKRFESGRYQLGGLTLYVTRGLGLEGKGAPRVRFLCPPEVVLWEIGQGL
ncbi:MAG: metallophosphoesterase [Anaerolineales bacterium]|nr:metallophosphoesterase [Anaerolineales bacterium]